MECIDAVIKGSWSELLSVRCNFSLYTDGAVLLLASGKQARKEGEGFLIPGHCRACGESRDGGEGQKVNERASSSPGRKEESFR